MAIIGEQLARVQRRIALACEAGGRPVHSVTLLAVSKTFGADAVRSAFDAGARRFGENYVQEAVDKIEALAGLRESIEWHLIGPLQSNKAREAVELFDVIETVDRPKIAEALADAMAKSGRTPRLLVQVNTGAEPQKAGVAPEVADAFLANCRDRLGLKVEGLMCIPPADQQASPHFALLATIAGRNGLDVLSMGMSADFELGLQLGATHVRVGSAIFGQRARPGQVVRA